MIISVFFVVVVEQCRVHDAVNECIVVLRFTRECI
jgi:hypothetical protein